MTTRLARLLPNLERMKRKDQIAALQSTLTDKLAEAHAFGETARAAEGSREKALADARLVLAEISARENSR